MSAAKTSEGFVDLTSGTICIRNLTQAARSEVSGEHYNPTVKVKVKV
jgi:hypothetical protein